MLNFIKHINPADLLKDKHIACVEIVILSEENWTYNLIILKKEKNILRIKDTKTAIKSMDELLTAIPSKMPVCLVVHGKGFIHKKMRLTNDDEESAILSKILPNASTNDFYIQKSGSDGEYSFISIVRKEIIEHIVNIFSEKKLFVVDLFLGPFHIEPIIPLLNIPEELKLAHFTLKIENSCITECIAANGSDYDVTICQLGDEQISTKTILPFAAGFQYLVINKAKPSTAILPILNSHKEYSYSNRFKIYGWSALIFFFGILIINFFIFDTLSKKYGELSLKISQYEELLVKQEQVEKEVQSKKQFLEKTGLLQSSRISFYADRLAYQLPEGIRLTELSVNPLVNKKSTAEEISFINNIINITGTTQRSTIFNDWIKRTKQNEWVKELTILNYTQQQIKEPAEFAIEILIR